MRTCPIFFSCHGYGLLNSSPPREGFESWPEGPKSLQFKTRSSKNSVTSQLSGSSARKFRKCSPTCVDEAINLSLCLMSSSVSTPFSMARWSVNCDLFVLPMGGVRAKQRNVKITEKVMIVWVRNPAPRSLISWTVSSRLISFDSFRPRVSAQRLSSKACLWLTTIQFPRGLTGLSSRARS